MAGEHYYWVTGINPEPWTAGTAYRRPKGAGIAKDGKLRAYQEALAEEFPLQNAHACKHNGELAVTFYFWRSSAHGNQADATNLQKATEDALQDILYGNDRTNRDVRSIIVDQGPNVSPHILIEIQKFDASSIKVVPPETQPAPRWAGTDWTEPEEDLF